MSKPSFTDEWINEESERIAQRDGQNQIAIGICGMAAAMRGYYERRIVEQDQLLRQARDTFARICDGTFHGDDAEDAAADWLRAYGEELDNDD